MQAEKRTAVVPIPKINDKTIPTENPTIAPLCSSGFSVKNTQQQYCLLVNVFYIPDVGKGCDNVLLPAVETIIILACCIVDMC